jgi:hypothetical protein
MGRTTLSKTLVWKAAVIATCNGCLTVVWS